MPSLRAHWTLRWLVVVVAVAVALMLPSMLAAQGATGRIVGRVADPSGYVKPSRKRQIQDVADTIEEYKERQSERRADRGVSPIAEAVLSDPELFGGKENTRVM